MADKTPPIFDMEDSPGYEIDGMRAVGYDTAVRAVRSPGGKHTDFSVVRQNDAPMPEAPRKTMLRRGLVWMGRSTVMILLAVIAAVVAGGILFYVGWTS
ncbi:hypothetical protein [Aurantimonas coralicida]|uniref:hypothetical protein n=1 Tax=Aurantimonas coralicida TaxID=182270 RepID=UPI001D18AE5E|nr:hypothetical protein [Aurantimonas coralicida]MCC4298125.1 hypothetical protein [Aurantimonas coralicida]